MKPPLHEIDDGIDENDETIRLVVSALLSLGGNPTDSQSITMPSPPKVKNKKRKLELSPFEKMMRKRKRASAAAAEIIDSKDAQLPTWMIGKIQEMGGSDVEIVFQRELYDSDVKKTNNRLSMPLSKIKNFLSEAERKWLDETTPTMEEKKRKNKKKRKRKLLNSLGVKMIDTNGNIVEEEMNVRKWTMGRNNETVIYNLVTGWNHLVKSNDLKEGMKVQLWSFRVLSQLWFALIRVE
ncbi:B3 domain-containing protein At3g25182-like [Impatiens glandulifera]|uniref:B3 domain-containing protein At3g25182-like n=1 Tax=Impatiens glandulifera TaxID=253017 RepID=UPI001FB1718F|nr:B3 domain-containing protein At3g25182-like [Impatiens glandulifera]XP_047335293.1 B3 domain-containing protein At3g25182-like [Impatiens glandulifera]